MADFDDFRNCSYLIIGGTSKAATTSLFYYLADHPQVCAANMKEVRFFLDRNYPLPSKYRFEDGLEKYAKFFSHCDNTKLRVEATPAYLYSRGTPYKIKNSLPNSKLVFILREPISRVISCYRFNRQNGVIPKTMSFDEYIKLCFNTKNKKKLCFFALEEGKYSNFLVPYYKLFGNDRIHIIFYEELSKFPKEVMKNLCLFANIDPNFYNSYRFEIYNPTLTTRFPSIHKMYMKLRFHIRKHTHDKSIHKFLRKVRLQFERVYKYLNVKPSERIEISLSTMNFLRSYYEEDKISLETLIRRKLPWGDYDYIKNDYIKSFKF